LRLALAGLPTPPAWTVQSPEAAAAIITAEAAQGHELVLKPLFGAQGRGLLRLRNPELLPPSDAVAGIYYLQRFIAPAESTFRDCRVLVSNGRAIAERCFGSMRTGSRMSTRGLAASRSLPRKRWRSYLSPLPRRWERFMPGSISSAARMGCGRCWRSTRCRLGEDCRASPLSASRPAWLQMRWLR